MPNKNELLVPTFLKRWRKHRRLTQEELAVLAELTAASVSQLETSKQGFTSDSLSRLARALKCSPVALLAYDPSKEDSFWPLFEAAEALQGNDRQRARAIMQTALDQFVGR